MLFCYILCVCVCVCVCVFTWALCMYTLMYIYMSVCFCVCACICMCCTHVYVCVCFNVCLCVCVCVCVCVCANYHTDWPTMMTSHLTSGQENVNLISKLTKIPFFVICSKVGLTLSLSATNLEDSWVLKEKSSNIGLSNRL